MGGMMNNKGQKNENQLDHVLVNMAGPTTEFAMVKPGTNQSLHSIKKYNSENFATATDCIQTYARDHNITLKGRRCAIAVNAAVNGDVVKVSRGNWTFSALGFSHMFGTKPAIVNDVAALSWANLKGSKLTHKSLTLAAETNFSRPGKYITIILSEGTGAATLVVTAHGERYIFDSELGHTTFYPANAVERDIQKALSLGKLQVSWENILSMSDDDPFWSKDPISISSSERSKIKASILGSFVSDAVLSQTAWGGVFLYGKCPEYLNKPENVAIFKNRFEAKDTYRLNLKSTPIWLVSMANAELLGCASLLEHSAN